MGMKIGGTNLENRNRKYDSESRTVKDHQETQDMCNRPRTVAKVQKNCEQYVYSRQNVEKVGFLWELSGAKERLKIFKAGLMVEGSFDKAIEGVDGVFHTAAPLLISYDHNDQIDPSIEDTLNVLSSCTKASSVRRVVLTSSCSAIRYRYDVQQVSPLNESHWSELEYYCKRYNLCWSLTCSTANKYTQLILTIVKGLRGEYQNTTIGFVHIDDVIAAHILAMEDSEASGRLICSSSVAHWSDIIDMLRSKYPTYPFDNK
ncbi:tetraketide alpha-pyrone reductase 2-like [Camellia sinensis]|uniref:tetraketide alpha-pyrone reductase 2-like n=1 Tax=Camellia sinensis TaxID=4442 RepID=UPI0010356E26|nr:tetraketide alpha-pyrone reductase 2-like [Camellia sinensis]